jgi:glycerol-3-phosphate acyltransferase PlsY
MLLLFFIILAYILGSLSTAIITSKLMKLPDPRTQGSGNPGATNMLRVGGKKIAVIVLLGDLLKGLLPVLIAKLVGVPEHLLGWIALAAFLGHLFPLFFKFKGGKGVATAIGTIIILSWPLALMLIGTWLLVTIISRYSALAAVISAALAPLYAYWLLSGVNYFAVLVMCILLIIRHADNIQRLWAGTEKKVGKN